MSHGGMILTGENRNLASTAHHIRIFLNTKMVKLKVVRPLKIYQDTKFRGRSLTGANFSSTSQV
jgi:hypothetical protein